MKHFIPLGIIVAFAVGVAVWHNFITAGNMHLHQLYPLLYQFPVVLAGLFYGWKGGAGTALFVTLLSIPHILYVMKNDTMLFPNSIVEIAVYFAVGIAIGIVSDRMREEQRAKAELLSNFRLGEKKSALGEVAFVLTHELKTPIASLTGAVELLGDETTSPEHRREYLAIIGKELKRMNGLVMGTLSLFRDRKPELVPVHVPTFLREVAGIAAVMRKVRPHVQAICDLRNENSVLAPDLLKEALLNLIDNALEASVEPARIELTASDRDGALSISVRDHGRGMDATACAKAFTPFFTTKADGTGLGLAVVKRIAEVHGGGITCGNAPGEGSVFTLRLPAREV
jgi:signal transduction histidine kinase